LTSFPPFASNDTLLNVQSSVAATRNCVKNIFEIRFSLRGRSEQRLPSLEQVGNALQTRYADAASSASPSRT
jgi:hypothetical protein